MEAIAVPGDCDGGDVAWFNAGSTHNLPDRVCSGGPQVDLRSLRVSRRAGVERAGAARDRDRAQSLIV
jgi:hypothetical protein